MPGQPGEGIGAGGEGIQVLPPTHPIVSRDAAFDWGQVRRGGVGGGLKLTPYTRCHLQGGGRLGSQEDWTQPVPTTRPPLKKLCFLWPILFFFLGGGGGGGRGGNRKKKEKKEKKNLRPPEWP